MAQNTIPTSVTTLTLDDKEYLSIAEAMRRYGYTRQHITFLINQAASIDAIKIGNMRWIEHDSLKKYILFHGRPLEKRKPRKASV